MTDQTFIFSSSEPPVANRFNKPVPRSNLPRPQAIGRSGSSASSRSGATLNQSKSPTPSQASAELTKPEAAIPDEQKPVLSDSDSNEEDDERLDNLLKTCFTSGMAIPKSRSEPVDLKSKSLTKLRRDKSSTSASNSAEKSRERSKSKSPRNSRFIPGVRITELKLVSRNSEQPKSGNSTPTKAEREAVNEIGEVEFQPVADLPVEPVDSEPLSPVKTETEPSKTTVDDDVTLMETLTESRVLELEANRVVETVVEHQKLQQQSHYRFNLAKRTLIGSGEDSLTRYCEKMVICPCNW